MKKILFSLIAVFALVQVKAQDISIGAIGGLNYSIISQKVDPEPAGFENDNAKGLGFFFGGFGEYKLQEGINLRAELQLSFRSTRVKSETTEVEGGFSYEVKQDYTNRDNFLIIPILIDYEVNEMLSLQAGPSFGFLLGAKQKGESTSTTTIAGVTDTQTFNFDGSSTVGRKGFEFGIALGGMYNVAEGVDVGLRYTRAFSDIATNTSFGGSTYKQKYNVFQVLVSYSLGEI